jgi:hypothetical protein
MELDMMAEPLFRVYLEQIMSGLLAVQVWSSSDYFKFSPVHSFSEVYVKCCVS